jgi:hypothetical protein
MQCAGNQLDKDEPRPANHSLRNLHEGGYSRRFTIKPFEWRRRELHPRPPCGTISTRRETAGLPILIFTARQARGILTLFVITMREIVKGCQQALTQWTQCNGF